MMLPNCRRRSIPRSDRGSSHCHPTRFLGLAGGDITHVWARIEKSFQRPPDVQALFDPPLVCTYEWTATYTSESYLDMLATQSPYIRLDAVRPSRVFDGIARLIEGRLNGTVTKPYLAILAVAGKAVRPP